MIDIPLLKKMLVRDEGERLALYRCSAGKLTIGVGRNIEANGITKNESDLMLTNDVNAVISGLKHALWFFNDLDPVRKLVLANMAFNMGLTRFLGFKKMVAALAVDNYNEAAKEMINSVWAKQVGERARRLEKMMITGELAE